MIHNSGQHRREWAKIQRRSWDDTKYWFRKSVLSGFQIPNVKPSWLVSYIYTSYRSSRIGQGNSLSWSKHFITDGALQKRMLRHITIINPQVINALSLVCYSFSMHIWMMVDVPGYKPIAPRETTLVTSRHIRPISMQNSRYFVSRWSNLQEINPQGFFRRPNSYNKACVAPLTSRR